MECAAHSGCWRERDGPQARSQMSRQAESEIRVVEKV